MFYIVNKQTRELIKTSQTPINIDESINDFGDLIQLKRVDDETKPAFNSATQKLDRTFTDDDKNFTRTFAYIVVSLTQAELDVKAEQTAAEATRQQLKTMYSAITNGTGTAGERIARLEKAVSYLLRVEVKG